MTQIPTIQDIYDDLIAAFEAEFGISVNDEGNAWVPALCGVLAGKLYLYYLGIGDLQKNIWFDTADSVRNGGTLERFGTIILGRWPFAATAGKYTCSVTGTNGAVIPGTTVFKADDTSESPGKLFQIVGGDYTLDGSGDTIQIVALEGGEASKMQVADTLTSTTPLVNVGLSIAVTTEDVAPVDAETIEAYRENIKEKVQLEPGSWSAVDYRLVGLNVAGVGQVYAYASSGNSGVVDVYLQGNTPVAHPGPSVSSGVIADYTAALEAVRPLGVFQVNYNSCPIKNVDITITMGSFPAFTSAQQTLIQQALTDFVNSVHPFIAAADNLADRNDVIAKYNLNAEIAAAVPGYGFADVTFTVAGTPQTEWEADNGEIPFMNSVTYA
jgi:uncharacterized phage protein gp47/JayE